MPIAGSRPRGPPCRPHGAHLGGGCSFCQSFPSSTRGQSFDGMPAACGKALGGGERCIPLFSLSTGHRTKSTSLSSLDSLSWFCSPVQVDLGEVPLGCLGKYCYGGTIYHIYSDNCIAAYTPKRVAACGRSEKAAYCVSALALSHTFSPPKTYVPPLRRRTAEDVFGWPATHTHLGRRM